MPSPIKYHSNEITQAYKSIERKAEYELLNLLPVDIQADYKSVLVEEHIPSEQKAIIKAADTISAYQNVRWKSQQVIQNFLKQ